AGAHAVPVATACRPGPLPPPDPRSLDEAARLLAGASRPVLIAGLQCRSVTDAQWLRALAEALPAPVLLTLRAKGILPDPHPLMPRLLGPGGGEAPRLGLDAGPHAAALATAWDAVAPVEFVASYGPATAGFALPAAIAAHLVHPDRRAVCFTGGTAFLAALSELPTAIRLRAPIVVVAIAD